MAEPIVDDFELKKGTGFRYSARIEVRPPLEPKEGGNLAACHFPLTDAEVAAMAPAAPSGAGSA